MADSHHEMLAKHQQNDDGDGGWHRVCRGRANADQQGMTLFAGSGGSPPSPADHPPIGLHLVGMGGCGRVSALPVCHQTLSLPRVLCNITHSSPEMEVLLQCQLVCGCPFLDVFLTSSKGVDLYADRLICEYIRYVNFHVNRPSTLRRKLSSPLTKLIMKQWTNKNNMSTNIWSKHAKIHH